MEVIFSSELVQTSLFALLSVVVFIAIAKVLGFFDVKAEKPNSCSKCRKNMTKPEEIASLKYKREDAYKGRYYCEACLNIILNKKSKRVQK